MKKNKVFGILAAVLMIVVTIIPAINGSILKINETTVNNEEDIKYDLTATLLDVELVSDHPEWLDRDEDGKIDGYYSSYKVDYEIYNKGPDKYVGVPETHVSPKDMPLFYIDVWYEKDENGDPIEIGNNETLTRSRVVKVDTSEEENIDWEENILNDNILLEVKTGGGELDGGDNFDIKKILKFFTNSKYWMPTTGQLKVFGKTYETSKVNYILNGNSVSFPFPKFMQENTYFSNGLTRLKQEINNKLGSFKNEPHYNQSALGLGENEFHITDKYTINTNDADKDGIWDSIILSGFDVDLILEMWILLEESVEFLFEEISQAWNNHRFGWIRELSLYGGRIIVDLIAFGLFCLGFYQDGKEYFDEIARWLEDIFLAISITISTGVFAKSIFSKVLSGSGDVLLAIYNLIKIFFENGWSVLLYSIIEKFKLDIDKLLDFWGENPWEDPIIVKGKVGQLHSGEEVEISCRDKETHVYVNNEDYEITDVPSDTRSGDIGGRKGLHLCQIICDGTLHREIKTPKVSSYCFSGGTIYRRFLLDLEEPPERKDKTKNLVKKTDISIFLETFDAFLKTFQLPFMQRLQLVQI